MVKQSTRVFDPYSINSFNIYALEHLIFQLGFSEGCKSPKECLTRFISSKQDKLTIPDYLLKDEYIYAICTEVYFWERGDFPKNQQEVQEWLSTKENANVS